MKTIRIGTRESRLALIQSQTVRDYILNSKESLQAQLVPIKTTGDRILDKSLDKIGGKGLFVKELDTALIEGNSDLSVHSLKDVPMEIPEELPLIGFSKREDARDVLILPRGRKELDVRLPIGCSSLRRTIQLKRIYKNAEIKGVRGNVLTRLSKLDNGEYGALVLAAAGIKRLQLTERIYRYFSIEEIVPAAGQGILAVQGKKGVDYSYLAGYFCQDSYYLAIGERAFVKYLNGGCSSPVAAHGVMTEDEIKLTGLFFNQKEDTYYLDTMKGKKENAEVMGITLAKRMQEMYGDSPESH